MEIHSQSPRTDVGRKLWHHVKGHILLHVGHLREPHLLCREWRRKLLISHLRISLEVLRVLHPEMSSLHVVSMRSLSSWRIHTFC